MKRRFNNTGRRRIPHTDITLWLCRNRGGDSQMRLVGEIAFPNVSEYQADAEVLLQLRAGERKTVNLGPLNRTVAVDIVMGDDVTMASAVQVDVRVVRAHDPAKCLLALARSITVRSKADDESLNPLLHTRQGQFELPLWRVEFDGEQPFLEISSRFDFRELIRSDPFTALVLPCVVRQIARKFLIDDQSDGDVDVEFDTTESSGRWLKWLFSLPQAPQWDPQADEDQREEWLSTLEEAAAARFDVLRRADKLVGMISVEEDS